MGRKMVVLIPDGASPVLEEVRAHDELHLQRRLTENPDLIPIEEFGWEGPLMVVGRETTLPSGSVDLVAIARSGQILVAEFKTGPQNPDFRGALAQAIDYGADLWGMSYSQFEEAVALRYFNSSHCPEDAPNRKAVSLEAAALATWGPDWTDETSQQFRERLEVALATGKIHYAVVAQRFTPAMERTAAYLNALGMAAGMYLVELIRFSNGSMDAFEARTVLKPEPLSRAQASPKGTLNEASFLERETDELRKHRLKDFLEFCSGLGLILKWYINGPSIRLANSDRAEPLSIGWLFTTGETNGWMGLSQLTLGFDQNSSSKTPSLAPALEVYRQKLQAMSGAISVKPKNLTAFTFSSEAEVLNMSAIKEALANLVEAAARS